MATLDPKKTFVVKRVIAKKGRRAGQEIEFVDTVENKFSCMFVDFCKSEGCTVLDYTKPAGAKDEDDE